MQAAERRRQGADARYRALALELYARQAKNTDAERKAADVRLRAERRSGELLKELARSEGGRPAKNSSDGATSFEAASPYAAALERTGMSRQTASRYQALADLPKAQFRPFCRHEVAGY